MITLHHLNNSRSQRILWLLEELGVPYKVERYERDPRTMLAPASLKKVHPLGKSPVITDGGATLAESAAIIEYLTGKYGAGKLRPTDEAAALRFTYFLHYAEGSVMPALLVALIISRFDKPPAPWPVRPIGKLIAGGVYKAFLGPQLKTHFDFIESELAARPWFAGENFSAADVQMSFPMEAAAARGILNERPKSLAFVRTIQARPAYQRALAAGGPYDLG